MAGQIDKQQKERLVARGHWRRFLARRDALKAEGLAPNEARTAAADELLAEDEDQSAAKSAPGNGELALPTAPYELEGKTAAEPAVIRWVARNIDVPEPDPGGCPDPFAWTLLRQCRSDARFTAFFVEKLWSKLIPTRSQPGTGRAADVNGQPTLDLIQRIQGMRDKAIREASAAR